MNERTKELLRQLVELARRISEEDETGKDVGGVGIMGGFRPPDPITPPPPPPPPPGPAPGPSPTPPPSGGGFYCYSCGRWNAV